jgi:tetratricopeptide (TPR) repeat protein
MVEDHVEKALLLGEARVALAFADAEVRATRKKGGAAHLAALRRRAAIGDEHADDEDMEDLAAVVRARREVTKHVDATSDDLENLAWAELLANAPRKAAESLGHAQRRDPGRSRDTLRAAIAWVSRRNDERLTALRHEADRADDLTLERITRLVVQAHGQAIDLASRLRDERVRDLAIWDRRVARAVDLLVRAHRVAGEGPSVEETVTGLLAAWVRDVDAALPDAEDARRFVADGARMHRAPVAEELVARERRLARAVAVFGADSPALEGSLGALAYAAEQAGAYDVAVRCLRKLDAIRARKKGADALWHRHTGLIALRRALIKLGDYDEAMKVVALEEEVAARRPGHLVPQHHARAEVLEAQGRLDAMVAEHLAAVAQYEASPFYGPRATNTELARGWARQALTRAGRAEADDLLGSG